MNDAQLPINKLAKEILDQSVDMISVHDLDGVYLYASPSSKSHLGYDQEELRGTSAYNYFHPEDLKDIQKSHSSVTNSKDDNIVTYRMKCKDGNYIWFETISKVITSDLLEEPVIIAFTREITSRKKMEKLFQKTKESYESIFSNFSIGVAVVSKEGQLVDWNDTFKQMISYSNEDLMRMNLRNFIHAKDHEKEFTLFNQLTSQKIKTYQNEMRFIQKDGNVFWGRVTVKSVLKENGQFEFAVGLIENINDRKKIEEELKEEQKKYQTLVEDAMIGVYVIQHGKIIYANPFLEKMIGYKMEELYSKHIVDLIVYDDKQRLLNNLELRVRGKRKDKISTYHLMTKNNEVLSIEVNISLTTYKGEPALIGTIADITDRKKAEDQINYLAYFDSLTGLKNRNSLQNKLTEKTKKNLPFSLLFIDLDRFKMINDTLGHSYGDELLKKAAKRIDESVKHHGDVYRYGGDEFIIILNGDDVKTNNTCENIIDSFKNQFTVFGQNVYTTPSIGVSQFPVDGDDAETLIKHADIAMYEAKDRGRNNYYYYKTSYNKKVSRKMEIDVALRNALEKRDFILHYQPQVDLITNKIIGVEALIRWNHPELGIISPGEFIPLAEETGLIVPIGIQVFEDACSQLQRWNEKGFDINLSINVSPLQFQHKNFVDIVRLLIISNNLDPTKVEIELTEGIMEKNERALNVLTILKKIGCKIAIDDFGTGYSSLSKLSELPVDIIKIDQSFMRDVFTNEKRASLVRSINKLGQELGFQVIAEGVELKKQIDFLLEENCYIAQGYYFSRPLPSSDIEKLLFNNH
jgi:diguanylate cyclase (GGDEF)-like protein/PAS domain S-box-containing protein